MTALSPDTSRDFKRDRIGGSRYSAAHSRVTYMAHAKGWVMCRHPACVPFVVPEQTWREFPLWVRPAAPVAP